MAVAGRYFLCSDVLHDLGFLYVSCPMVASVLMQMHHATVVHLYIRPVIVLYVESHCLFLLLFAYFFLLLFKLFYEVNLYGSQFILRTLLKLVVFGISLLLSQLGGNTPRMG